MNRKDLIMIRDELKVMEGQLYLLTKKIDELLKPCQKE